MKKSILIFFIVIFGIVFYSCGKDCTDDQNPECPNFNPCKGLPNRPASFKMFQYLYLPKIEADSLQYIKYNYFEDGDISFPDDAIYFEADMPNAESYEWQIGNEAQRRIGKRIDVGFYGTNEKSIKITLFVKYKQNFKCLEKFNGNDTLSKTINFVKYLEHPAWKHTYIGSWDFRPNKIDTIFFRTKATRTDEEGINYNDKTGLYWLLDTTNKKFVDLTDAIYSRPIFNGLFIRSNIYGRFYHFEEFTSMEGKLIYNLKNNDVYIVALISDIIGPKEEQKVVKFKGRKL